MQLAEAEKYAAIVIPAIAPYVSRYEVVGSIRRRRETVNDIDLIAIPHLLGFTDDQAWNKIPHVLNQRLNAAVERRGKELIRILMPNCLETPAKNSNPFVDYRHSVQVDLYRARPETWGILELVRTGSKEHNVELCAHALKHQMMLSAARGILKGGVVIASKTELDIFQALGLPYVEPKDREVE